MPPSTITCAAHLSEVLGTLFVDHVKVILGELGESTAGVRADLEERVMKVYLDPVMHNTVTQVVYGVCNRFSARLARPRMSGSGRVVRRLDRAFARVAAADPPAAAATPGVAADPPAAAATPGAVDMDIESIDIEHTDDETDEDSGDDNEESMRDFIATSPSSSETTDAASSPPCMLYMMRAGKAFVVPGSPDMIHV